MRATNSVAVVVAVAVISLAFACSLRADDGRPKTGETGSFEGAIKSIELETRALTVKSAKSEMSFPVAADAKIVGKDKKEASLGDLKVGETVRVDYAEENGLLVAHQITLKQKELLPPPSEGDKGINF